MKNNKKVIAFIVSVMMLITTVSVVINATTVTSSAFSLFDCDTTTTTTTTTSSYFTKLSNDTNTPSNGTIKNGTVLYNASGSNIGTWSNGIQNVFQAKERYKNASNTEFYKLTHASLGTYYILKSGYNKLHTNLVVAIAMREDALGLTERQYTDRYNGTGWCDAFVRYVLSSSGVTTVSGGASTMWSNYNGIYSRYTSESGVKPGDLVFFGSGGSYSHVAICSYSSGSTVKVISGNWSNTVMEHEVTESFDWIDIPEK